MEVADAVSLSGLRTWDDDDRDRECDDHHDDLVSAGVYGEYDHVDVFDDRINFLEYVVEHEFEHEFEFVDLLVYEFIDLVVDEHEHEFEHVEHDPRDLQLHEGSHGSRGAG